MPSIVTVNVYQQQAPTPATLQRTSAFVSQDATTLTPGTFSLLTQYSDLADILKGAATLVSLSYSSGTVTATASADHGLPDGDVIEITIAGAAPSGYNGTFACTITGATTFTYALASNPGTDTSPGSYTLEDVSELVAMATTWFAQGAQLSVYVLELGAGGTAQGVTALTNYLATNPNSEYTPGATGYFYNYLLPREWSGEPTLPALIADYEATTSKTYFWVTMTLQNYAIYTDLMKDVIGLVEAPALGVWATNALTAATYSSGLATFTTTSAHGVSVGQWFQITGMTPTAWNGWYEAQVGTTGTTLIGAMASNPGSETGLGSLVGNTVSSTGVATTEFTLAAPMWVATNYAPSQTNQVTPFAFSFVYGVTPFPAQGLGATLSTLKSANINYIGTGAQGGISDLCLFWGTTMDGRDFTYWYSVDWFSITVNLNVSNAVINGSNNPLNPLYYSQGGINQLQDVVVATATSAINVGLANGQVTRSTLNGSDFAAAINAGQFGGQIVVNAVPFLDYLTVNPDDYKTGDYAGLSVLYIPNRGFISIVIDVLVTDFVATQ